MTRELIEAAKAVCDDAERGAKGVVTVFGEPQSVIDAHLVASLRAAVRAAEAAPVEDAVSVPVATLRKWQEWAVTDCIHSDRVVNAAMIESEITALLPPPARPEPPKELVAEWERMATKYVRDLMLGGPDAAFLEHSPHVMRAYVAALRAAWEADPKGKQ